jgi:hypothetical protein
MKNVLLILLTITSALVLISCGTGGRVLKQTDKMAVIQGTGETEFEAKEEATKEAEKIFGKVKETQKPECNKEYQSKGETSGTGADQQYQHKGQTYYSCVLYFEKK